MKIIVLVLVLVVDLCIAGGKELSEKEQENLDQFIKEKVNSKGEGNTCPTFSCSKDNQDFADIIFCHKNKLDNPFEVTLKNCATFFKMSDSDFWGRPKQNVSARQPLFCHHEQNRCVEDPFVEIVNKLPGHTCINNYECLSGRCELNSTEEGGDGLTYCQDSYEDEACLSHINCGVGLYCHSESRVCKLQLPKGKSCENDFNCENHLACANGKCVEYGGLFNGQESDNALACQDGWIDQVEQLNGHKMNKTLCFGAPQLDPEFLQPEEDGQNKYRCSDANDTCVYQLVSPTTQNFSLKCECGLSPTGQSYCPRLFKKNYPKLLTKVIQAFGQNCHTTERFDIYKCYLRDATARMELIRKILPAEDFNNQDSILHYQYAMWLEGTLQQNEMLNNFTVAYYEREHFHMLQDNDECMKHHSSVALYWEAQKYVKQKLSQLDMMDIKYNDTDRQWGGANTNYHRQHLESFNAVNKMVEKPIFWAFAFVFSLFLVPSLF